MLLVYCCAASILREMAQTKSGFVSELVKIDAFFNLQFSSETTNQDRNCVKVAHERAIAEIILKVFINLVELLNCIQQFLLLLPWCALRLAGCCLFQFSRQNGTETNRQLAAAGLLFIASVIFSFWLRFRNKINSQFSECETSLLMKLK